MLPSLDSLKFKNYQLVIGIEIVFLFPHRFLYWITDPWRDWHDTSPELYLLFLGVVIGLKTFHGDLEKVCLIFLKFILY